MWAQVRMMWNEEAKMEGRKKTGMQEGGTREAEWREEEGAWKGDGQLCHSRGGEESTNWPITIKRRTTHDATKRDMRAASPFCFCPFMGSSMAVSHSLTLRRRHPTPFSSFQSNLRRPSSEIRPLLADWTDRKWSTSGGE
jgi:hypothetical protein